jgi:glycosyltransferase involved in cell wall biosynthesis
VPENKIFVIYNAFEEPKLLEKKEELRKKLGFDGPVILSVGRLVPWKGFPVLIEAIPELLKEFPNLKLYIIGDGPDKDYLKSQILNLKLEDKIILTGKLPQEKVFQYIKAADVFVLNTSYEGLSHQLLEVLALGIPIVTTRAGGNVETVEDGKTGLFVPYNDKRAIIDAVNRLLKDNNFANELVKNGLQSLGIFTEEHMLDELCKLLK